MLKRSMASNALILGIFALVTAGTLAVTQITTREPIERAIREASAKALLEIIPLDRHSNDILVDTYPIPKAYWNQLGLGTGGEINLAREEDGSISAVIIPAVAPDGYSGPISLLVGVNRDGTIAGVRVTAHTETPGLGDKVDLKKSDWILQFNGLSLQDPPIDQWKVQKDGGAFDQFTGATITPRAVVNQVRRVLEFVASHREEIFSAPVSKRAVEVEQPEKEKQ
ncbi:electron transport complex subunit RsxG [Microbulbifer thermotolerans]|uniref:Ion-translocating oxidoreductase complex subunit G n=1 Tax=Microbulbifer thermotolerans TaxID=252514 RepID=A0AB35HUV1_MICTH|nr:electron transport complex subunit RsxG [Microbulbifer thermotolerans]MCX2779472.1 electron transport complex subunit RsxG [Microbulbifer thermotolerans]MCX2784015.1 electron transport complex subunit RsxG [Microbulbifer thermotolerans]MCX2801282.1 electron transport complex subunit RsxG [Microbulbifer thermotolerans]MCX2806083.1 electron transport complex subunit RsxG [Microbulbifer thermotolerans]MCX2832408.1 electron transport complex subunit RsxG [Microbulbifer thermotolerans]